MSTGHRGRGAEVLSLAGVGVGVSAAIVAQEHGVILPRRVNLLLRHLRGITATGCGGDDPQVEYSAVEDGAAMSAATRAIVVAGHLCVDFIPSLPAPLDEIALPGGLGAIGPATWSLGGAVGNTGLALHKLGTPVRLVAKIGHDRFGGIIESILAEQSGSTALVRHLQRDPQLGTSYTICIDPPGVDRALFSHFGTLDATTADDILGSAEAYEGTAVLHFGCAFLPACVPGCPLLYSV